ncbi:MAG: hypothetical protein IKL49_07355 [Lachnospiraceae bacterium]|nr:hypothetical protein [Lachnospiraceae bacterium]
MKDSNNIIGKANGATSYFVLSRNNKLTLKQKIQKTRFQLRKKWIEKHISANGHTLDEVCQYVQEKYGFREVTRACSGVQYEYEEMRTSFMITHAPELLGEYAKHPELKGHSEEEIREFMAQVEVRKEIAKNVPKEKFDIDFHKYEKKICDTEMHVIIEKKYEYIGGGASGKKTIKDFNKMYKDVYRYYGVTEEDIAKKTKRYDMVVRTLARR